MAVTILGIIAATIGGVLVAAFSSTAGVNDRFDASRAAKQSSLYWSPDVASVATVNPGGVCGSGAGAGAIPLVTFQSFDHPAVSATPPLDEPGTERTTTWWLDDVSPARVVRRTCAGTAAAVVDPRNPVVSRIADRDEETAGVATDAAQARGQVAAECSTDGVAFHPCAADDPGTIVRLTVRVPDAGASRDSATPDTPRFKTYQFSVSGAREVR